MTIQDIALEKARLGELRHKDTGQPLTEEDIRAVFRDLRRLTEGGLFGGGGGGG